MELGARLNQAGGRFEFFPGLEQDERGVCTFPDGTQVAGFQDPDGNLLSISQFPVGSGQPGGGDYLEDQVQLSPDETSGKRTAGNFYGRGILGGNRICWNDLSAVCNSPEERSNYLSRSRENRTADSLRLSREASMLEAKIETRLGFTVVGVKYRGKNENEEIPRLWDMFWPRHAEIQERTASHEAYGVLDNFDVERGDFDYIAGVAVERELDPPAGMTLKHIPAQTYAVFECTLPTLMETFREINEVWFPNSTVRRASGPEFELYDERFDPSNGKFVMSICIPVQPA
jgi:AraC family transcriptional regulator